MKHLSLCLLVWTTTILSLPIFAQTITVPYEYKKDRDGDGVPDVRDSCPDTDYNLNGQEFEVEVKGKKMFVKIVDLKGAFETRRRRVLVELSRLADEKRKLLKPVNNNINKLDEASKARIAEIDTLDKNKRLDLADLVYEAKITVDGKLETIEIPVHVDEFGCLPDRDRDNVPDIVDKCPDVAGVKAFFGCNDRDGDGVLDHEDECPDVPGLKRLKGCPDKGTGDRDKDGTMDKDDLCPDVPGPKSNKGCPELVNDKQKELIEKASRVLFATAKADLRPESLAILDELANVIFDISKKFGKLIIRLEGHTDSDGTNEDNLELSRNRSRSVKDYLVSKGVDISWISTAGNGEEMPVATNTTPAGKQKNRRVEIAITTQEQK